MMTSVIYGIFNAINGKVLVGSTNNFLIRWPEHKRQARMGKHPNPHFQRAWKTYGEKSFEFRVIEHCDVSILLPRENYWMMFYKSMDDSFGYNMQNAFMTFRTPSRRMGGNMKGKHHSEETKKKLSIINTGKKYSEERKNSMSESMKGTRNHFYGKRHTPECIEINRQAHIGQKAGMTGKHHSEETKIKCGKANIGNKYTLGRRHTEESKRKMSDALKGSNHPFYGKHRSEETRAKLSEAAKRQHERKRLNSLRT